MDHRQVSREYILASMSVNHWPTTLLIQIAFNWTGRADYAMFLALFLILLRYVALHRIAYAASCYEQDMVNAVFLE